MQSKLISIISIAALLVSSLVAYSYYANKHKAGYIIIQEVFENFEMKKELGKKYDGVRNVRKKLLDSLQIDISILSNRLSNQKTKPSDADIDLFERKKMEFNKRMQEFDESNMQMTKEFDEKIITQLNQYVSDFGKLNGYDMIFGNTTNGSIMYGNEKYNITKDVIEFINNKYKGAN